MLRNALLLVLAALVCQFPTRSVLGDDGAETKAEARAEHDPTASYIESLRWRSIGPANMMGRITALAVDPSQPTRWYAATASGGLLKTENNGHTFTHRFDKQRVASIGAIAVSPSNPDIVWVGTGEANPRNSVSWGDGVYRSADGGATWKHMGLRESFQIGAVVVHPTNPDIVYVGCLGRLWGPNEERGLYKTTDGGKHWERVLYIDERTGVVDVKMHPEDPDTLLVATWERQRDAFDTNDPAKRWGPGSGLYRTTDGGQSFAKVTAGLPTKGKLGRICTDFCQSQPNVVYMVLDVDRIGKAPPDSPFMGITGTNAKDVGARLTQVTKKGPAEQAGLQVGDVVLEMDGAEVKNYAGFIRLIRKRRAKEVVKLTVLRKKERTAIELTLGTRPKRSRSPFAAALGGQRANTQEAQGPDGHEYGGVYRSDDAGVTWKRVNSLNPRPMYFSHIRVHPHDPKQVWVCGIRLWRSRDGGASFNPDGHDRSVHVDHHALWIDPQNPDHVILGNDGGLYVTYDDAKTWDHLNTVAIGQCYHVGIGPEDDYRVYTGLQDNGSWGAPSRVRHGRGPTNPDWVRVAGGDGFRCLVDREDPNLVYFESQNGGIGRRNFATGERASLRPRPERGKPRYRFNWNTPFLLSHHNSRIYYVAGNVVFRSLNRGNQLRKISDEITHTRRGAATALAESPRNPDVLYVGSDDGALFMTRNGGVSWTDCFEISPAAEPEPADEKAETPPQKDADGDGDDDAPSEVEKEGERPSEPKPTTSKPAKEDPSKAAPQAPAKPAPTSARPATRTPSGRPLAELVPERRHVAWIEASRHRAGRVYIALDGHRSDDDRPLLFVSEDHGRTWRSIHEGLPEDCGSTRTIREDLENPNLLFVGTEFGAYTSIDRGTTWHSLNTNLPTVAVHAFAIHPKAGELVAATHGRSLWILDITTLRQLTPKTVKAAVHLYRPGRAITWRPLPGLGASRVFQGENPPQGGVIRYALREKQKSVALEILGPDGKVLRTLATRTAAGLHTVIWDLRRNPPRDNRRRRRGTRVEPGTYTVRLRVGEVTQTAPIRVDIDPAYEDPRWMAHADAVEAEDAAAAEARWQRKFAPWQGED